MTAIEHITNECKLDAIFSAQSELMEVVEKHSGSTGTIPGNILAVIVEMGELANAEESFKWWKNQTKNKDKDKILDELVDALFFWVQIAIKLELSPSDIFKGYMKKWQVNINRQLDNY